MTLGNYVFQSDFAKKHRAAGRTEGKAEGKAEGVLQVLDARGIAVSEEQKARILACTDIAVLDRWIRRAVSVSSTEELFASESRTAHRRVAANLNEGARGASSRRRSSSPTRCCALRPRRSGGDA